MTPSLEQRRESSRRLPYVASPLPRAVADEYPAGYLAQLTRPFATRKSGRPRFAAGRRQAPGGPVGAASHADS
jgi:hypothetical protein